MQPESEIVFPREEHTIRLSNAKWSAFNIHIQLALYSLRRSYVGIYMHATMIREGRGSLFGREKEGYMGGITRMKGKGEAVQLYYNLKNKRCLQTETEGILKTS